MKDVIVSLFGEYQLTYTPEGALVGGLAGLDYAYIFGVLAFLIVLYSFFRLLGVLFQKLF